MIATLAAGRSGWLPRGVVLVSAIGAVAFAASNPDGRIASHNVDRFLEGGEIDRDHLAGLSADAAVPLTRLDCVPVRVQAELRRPDGVRGANLARSRARSALAGLPAAVTDCAH